MRPPPARPFAAPGAPPAPRRLTPQPLAPRRLAPQPLSAPAAPAQPPRPHAAESPADAAATLQSGASKQLAAATWEPEQAQRTEAPQPWRVTPQPLAAQPGAPLTPPAN